MPVKKYILLCVGIAAATAVAVFGLATHRAWHKFSVEDQIHDDFLPVVNALYAYEAAHGSPATNLAQLVPAYIARIPRSPLADSVEYHVIEGGRAWQLSIHSRALSPPRLYCCRSSQKFTADEDRRVLLRYHGVWTVLRD